MFFRAKKDEELLAEIGSGNRGAFAELYSRHKNRVFGLSRRILGDLMLAEDATQEVWVKIVKNASQFRPGGSVKSWILTITRNHCLNELEKTGRLELREDLDEVAVDTADADPLAGLSNQEQVRRVQLAMDALSERHRLVICMFYQEELALPEIAEVLKIEINAVKALLFRAREALKRQVGDLDG